MKAELWNTLGKVTPEEYMPDRQAVSEGYEMPLEPLYRHDGIRASVEADQPDAGANRWGTQLVDEGGLCMSDDKGCSDLVRWSYPFVTLIGEMDA
jgi:hypothetical protein